MRPLELGVAKKTIMVSADGGSGGRPASAMTTAGRRARGGEVRESRWSAECSVRRLGCKEVGAAAAKCMAMTAALLQ